jgi:hypothetical protein
MKIQRHRKSRIRKVNNTLQFAERKRVTYQWFEDFDKWLNDLPKTDCQAYKMTK